MKKGLIILIISLFTGFASFAQTQDDDATEGGKIKDRMNEYIQDRLGLSKAEAEKFSPIFFHYFRDFIQVRRENRGDILITQQRIIELRLRYREEFKQIMDEQRANKVFKFEDQFRTEAKKIILENRRERMGPVRRRF